MMKVSFFSYSNEYMDEWRILGRIVIPESFIIINQAEFNLFKLTYQIILVILEFNIIFLDFIVKSILDYNFHCR